MATERIAIPEERLGVLIGKDGCVKKEIEKATNTRIDIGDDVEIEGKPLDVMIVVSIVKAIGRGFSPSEAMLLLDEKYELYVISLGKETRNTIKRLMGRVIGRKGAAKKKIEEITGVRISVYGKTVGIIGRADQIENATRCIQLLLSGKTHEYAYHAIHAIG